MLYQKTTVKNQWQKVLQWMFVAERSPVLSWPFDQNLRIQILLNTVDVLVLFM
jgi:hypothetical protein